MKVLFIKCSNKSDNKSVSTNVALDFLDKFKSCNTFELEEIDLFNIDLPKLEIDLITPDAHLNRNNQTIINLINQFKEADIYIISSPMWSMNIPYVLKHYIDCIVLNGSLIEISDTEIKGLLDDKERHMLYIQSSGGTYPKILDRYLNHGKTYLKDIFTFIGIKHFDTIEIQGNSSKDEMNNNIDRIQKIIDKKVKKITNNLEQKSI